MHKTQQTHYFNVFYFNPKYKECKENELNEKWKDFTNGQTAWAIIHCMFRVSIKFTVGSWFEYEAQPTMLIKFESCELAFIEVAKDIFFGRGSGGTLLWFEQ